MLNLKIHHVFSKINGKGYRLRSLQQRKILITILKDKSLLLLLFMLSPYEMLQSHGLQHASLIFASLYSKFAQTHVY